MTPTGQRATTPRTPSTAGGTGEAAGAGKTTTGKTAAKKTASREQPATRDRERTRRALLEATDHLLHERGTGFSLADVAARAEVSKGGLLYHFPTRDALVTAVVQTGLARFRDEVMSHVDLAENRPGKVLRGYVRALCGSSPEAVNTFA
ncbi:TetR/AcrR family transcriptional regulator, partial [Kineococcus sp. SYSU DK001]|uniref:TetR/AcrR family transcriptional regulator n=1 Tax=Kineococcus sp. SYSU DK001 TaxID=3383122 RepID=UPI003D7D9490